MLNLGLFSLEGLNIDISYEVADSTVNKEGRVYVALSAYLRTLRLELSYDSPLAPPVGS
jgi:hypothetical protein